MKLFSEFVGKCGVYRILNTRNGKFYIGSTNEAQRRFRTHANELSKNKHHSDYLQKSYNKETNKTVFKYEMLVISEEDVLLDLETRFIEQFSPPYNMLKAAHGRIIPWSKGKKFTEIHKQNLSKAKKLSPVTHRSKLKDFQVVDILNSNKPTPELALKYSVSRRVISDIRFGNTYKHIPRSKVWCWKKAHQLGWTSEKRQRQGDFSRGEKARDAKLTESQALEIITAVEKNIDLAKKYGVHPTTICNIRKGKTWKHLPRTSSSA